MTLGVRWIISWHIALWYSGVGAEPDKRRRWTSCALPVDLQGTLDEDPFKVAAWNWLPLWNVFPSTAWSGSSPYWWTWWPGLREGLSTMSSCWVAYNVFLLSGIYYWGPAETTSYWESLRCLVWRLAWDITVYAILEKRENAQFLQLDKKFVAHRSYRTCLNAVNFISIVNCFGAKSMWKFLCSIYFAI